ncbi:glutamine synthetase [Dactylosporangium aurantiacum]|uniref:Glutamine synthetase n=1 Tax=Dactylosporangium aurantiacum TaxID=35754 RepID=A0A9Q9MA27_9ACTN|nr:glutamine synthetase family protein [Dactylosporangium aurantiacum]MDG6107068.1 glutamine synthetase family protein [Dactylosporangium aurantiacum]UWZ51368.1 glutamine synthetase [Dactylosporangium aurantiacum]
MSELDRFVEDPARRERAADVGDRMRAAGVEYVYVQHVTVTGRVVGKGIPVEHWQDVADSGVQMVYGSVADLAVDRHGRYLGYPPEASELVSVPEPDTYAQLPWDRRVARVFGRLFRNRDERTDPGGVLTSDCRGNLARQHEEFRRRHDGLELRVGTEPEMMWLRRDAAGGVTGTTRPDCYHIEQFETLRPVTLRVIEYARAMGLDMIQGDHEDAPGQLELNFNYDEVRRNADRLVTYRQICRQVAREHGLVATFMAKPFGGLSGSGCHHNMSLWQGGQDGVAARDGDGAAPEVSARRTGGVNAFLDTAGSRQPSKLALHCIGGILEHLPALTAIGSSTVNSYRRLLDTGFWAPVRANWGVQNRTCAVRVSAPGRVEYRSVDAMVNPYLMGSALLAALDDGIAHAVDPGPPQDSSAYDDPGDRGDRDGFPPRALPESLGDALRALRADAVISGALPGDMSRVYHDVKRAEWERFLAVPTAWDVETYLDCVP